MALIKLIPIIHTMHNPLKNSLIVIIFCIVLASIDPLDWHSYLLHQIGTVFLMLPMAYLFIKHKISTKSLYAMTAFLLLHILGAKYLYSYVPYDQWSTVLFGIGINDIFGFKRNHYDRLVHFAYGVCLYPLIYDLIKHWFKTNSQKQLVFIVLTVNMATSMLYELFEWCLAIGLSPKQAEQYNGQQGDMWDAHKDMALALIGAIISSCCYAKIPKKAKY